MEGGEPCGVNLLEIAEVNGKKPDFAGEPRKGRERATDIGTEGML